MFHGAGPTATKRGKTDDDHVNVNVHVNVDVNVYVDVIVDGSCDAKIPSRRAGNFSLVVQSGNQDLFVVVSPLRPPSRSGY